jgi:hypothetical protein
MHKWYNLEMKPDEPPVSLIQQREIEARIVGPLVRAFAAELGQERVLTIVAEVIRDLARQRGAELARALGEQTLEALAESLDRWREGDALQIDVLEQTPSRLSFNVTRCRYAEMYRALGLADLGGTLSCQRDYALAEGFNPRIRLTRTQTIMEGASYCDFRFRIDGQAHSEANAPKHDEEGIFNRAPTRVAGRDAENSEDTGSTTRREAT